VPGVGDIVALTAIAVFSDATRFPSAKHGSSNSSPADRPSRATRPARATSPGRAHRSCAPCSCKRPTRREGIPSQPFTPRISVQNLTASYRETPTCLTDLGFRPMLLALTR
jgi:hypothetical protein